MKFTQGWVESTTEPPIRENIVVEAPMPIKGKDLIIGLAWIGVGVAYITMKAFKYGSLRHEIAEYDALVKCGCIKK